MFRQLLKLETITELIHTLHDAWRCADFGGHLDSWWNVATGATRVD